MVLTIYYPKINKSMLIGVVGLVVQVNTTSPFETTELVIPHEINACAESSCGDKNNLLVVLTPSTFAVHTLFTQSVVAIATCADGIL
mgnify:CR=1 FL=1